MLKVFIKKKYQILKESIAIIHVKHAFPNPKMVALAVQILDYFIQTMNAYVKMDIMMKQSIRIKAVKVY